MAILVGRETRVICQGLTGRAGTFHAARMLAYGTRIVGGVRPGKGGTRHLGVPVFDSVAEAVAATGANASIVLVPPAQAATAMIEAIHAEVPLVVCVTERVPLLDMVRVRQVLDRALDGTRTRLVGPNSQGILVPGVAQLGVMATTSAAKAGKGGGIGIVSRSASLTSEVVAQVTAAGLGQSVTVGVGGDPIHGLSLPECVELLVADDETRGIVLIGEIGGSDEEETAAAIARLRRTKPIVALIAGRHAPRLRRMGHAGAFATEQDGSAQSKIEALRAAGVLIAPNARNVGALMHDAL
jgi:succinyl-CoA synthetase alpha subunit